MTCLLRSNSLNWFVIWVKLFDFKLFCLFVAILGRLLHRTPHTLPFIALLDLLYVQIGQNMAFCAIFGYDFECSNDCSTCLDKRILKQNDTFCKLGSKFLKIKKTQNCVCSKRAIEEGKVRFQTSFRVENGLKYALKAINSQN